MPAPYYIIVSDEGHSAKPKRHLTYAQAEAEARRLSALKPEINFAIFEVKATFFTPKTEAKQTVFGPYLDFPRLKVVQVMMGTSKRWGFAYDNNFVPFGDSPLSAFEGLHHYLNGQRGFIVWPLDKVTLIDESTFIEE